MADPTSSKTNTALYKILLPFLEGLGGNPQLASQRARQKKEDEERERQAQLEAQFRDEQRIDRLAPVFRDLPQDDPLNAVNVPTDYSGKPTQYDDVSQMTSLPETPSGPEGSLDQVRNLFSRLESTDPFVGLQEARQYGGAMRSADENAFRTDTQREGQRRVDLAPSEATAQNIIEEGTRETQLDTREAQHEMDLKYDIEAHRQRSSISLEFDKARMRFSEALAGENGEVPKRTAEFADNKARAAVRLNQSTLMGAAAAGEDAGAYYEDVVNIVLQEGRENGIEIPLDVAQGAAADALQQFPGLLFYDNDDNTPTGPSAKLDKMAKDKSGRTRRRGE